MKEYKSPKVKIINIKVEKGFAISNIELPETKPEKVKSKFNLLKVEDGGRAW